MLTIVIKLFKLTGISYIFIYVLLLYVINELLITVSINQIQFFEIHETSILRDEEHFFFCYIIILFV